MKTFTPTMSTALAAATVNGTEAMVCVVKASERAGVERLECLHEAKENLLEWLRDVDAAITDEVKRVAA